jgi:hypothetical protein
MPAIACHACEACKPDDGTGYVRTTRPGTGFLPGPANHGGGATGRVTNGTLEAMATAGGTATTAARLMAQAAAAVGREAAILPFGETNARWT